MSKSKKKKKNNNQSNANVNTKIKENIENKEQANKTEIEENNIVEIETKDIPNIVDTEDSIKDFKTMDELIKEEKKEELIKPIKNKKNDEIEDITKHAKRDMILEYAPYLIIIFFVVIIRTFIATPVMVNGTSMDPTLKDGDVMLLYKLKKNIKGIKRFDIVVINTTSGRLIKRVIGLPGDKIKYVTSEEKKGVAKLYVNGEFVKEEFLEDSAKNATCSSSYPVNICNEEFTVSEGTYFVMGDNRGDSKDSRILGVIDEDKILGTTELILFPFDRIGKAN